MKHVLSAIFLFITISVTAQNAYIGASLKSLLKETESSDEFHQVDIVFAEKADLFALKQEFKEKNTPLAKRQKRVIRELMTAANAAQKPFLEELYQNYPHLFKNEKRFWVVNMMTLEAQPELLQELAKNPAIEFIDLSSARMTKPIDFMRGDEDVNRSPNGIEPGLAAINAPALWSMGYTGRGQVGYSIDTGVWPDHPAISENWLGNHIPLDQAWYWYDTQFPGDKNGAHGTHTIGTTMGLDRSNNDTIGVAFNAKFIASDPVATSINTVIPIAEFMPAFEYALNPDGDTSTVSDIPDAINNSWGFTVVQDTLFCDSYITDMFLAIEAAGIANVASAGNDGPGSATMTYPFHVNPGLVNTFTVGAVNGSNPAFPIASFSSRGPTTCSGDTALRIKPEVVAPGVNVRSAVENGGYANYQGTSMAGPHATGAVLLLKEAFPYLPGEEILLALYYTAIDLGDPGEDNSYGRGMIDVLAAYNYLAQSHTPVPPDSSHWDLAVEEIISPATGLTCEDNFSAQIVLTNKGDSAITDATIFYVLLDGMEYSQNWTGNLQSGQSDVVNLSQNISLTESTNYEFQVRVEIAGNVAELDTINNWRIQRFNHRAVENIPFIEQFEYSDLYRSEWYLENPDFNFTWDTMRTSGVDGGQFSGTMKFSNLIPNHQEDGLISPLIATPSSGDLKLKFDYSYLFWHPIFNDSLSVYISEDCGDTWPHKVFYAGGEDLGTVETNDPDQDFIPTLPEHWKDTIIDISQFATGSEILVKFLGKNGRGNYLALDNVKIYSGQEPMTVEELDRAVVRVYPNPSSDLFNLDLSQLEKPLEYRIHAIDGRLIKREQIKGEKQIQLNIKGAVGIYFLSVFHEGGKSVVKVVKE